MLIDRLLGFSVIAGEVPAIRERAWLRVSEGQCPARPGRQNMKDCVVVETVIEAIRAARKLGFDENAVFLSANTSDFGGTRGGKPHRQLEAAFDEVGLAYAVKFQHARYLLGI